MHQTHEAVCDRVDPKDVIRSYSDQGSQRRCYSGGVTARTEQTSLSARVG
jgi:hypothetical protein